MQNCQNFSTHRLVLFDTNVVESRYLAPLLRGEPIRDFALLCAQEEPYTPALALKSLFEILHHAKMGSKTYPWMDSALGYPGGLEEGQRILQQAPELATRENLYYWFGLCEEWRLLDWEAERELGLSHAEIRQEFATWKFRLQEFCDRIWDTIEDEMHILGPQTGDQAIRVADLMLELIHFSLIPNEDLEILAWALAEDAVAFITEDHRILNMTGLSLSLNVQTAFVHPRRLQEALNHQFGTRWSYAQTIPIETERA